MKRQTSCLSLTYSINTDDFNVLPNRDDVEHLMHLPFYLMTMICFTAAGLYYLAELVEEYTVLAKKCITWMVIVSRFIDFSHFYVFVYLIFFFHRLQVYYTAA